MNAEQVEKACNIIYYILLPVSSIGTAITSLYCLMSGMLPEASAFGILTAIPVLAVWKYHTSTKWDEMVTGRAGL